MNAFVAPIAVLHAESLCTPSTALRRTTFVTPARTQSRLPTVFLPARRTPPTASLESDVRTALNKLYDTTPCMPIMVRLAWHDAGTYKVADGTGGANASIRYLPEKGHAANNGLNIAMDLLEPIKAQFPAISYADLYQLASVVGIEHSGGPKVPFRMGRTDAGEADTTEDGRLPDADKRMGHLREVFYRMGLNDTEITVLSGAHTLGRAHQDRSGFDGPWTKVPVVFDNSYFVEILKDEPDPDLLRLSSDLALLDIPETKALCEKYANDQKAFFDDYILAHQKLSELGCFSTSNISSS
ncbi:Ascorbate Peroxidase, APX2 [Chondrus crispus]|uniref:Ascorbate Peroxidase, APX2 n=1 Tax=Chondrus crispus TaxID=2769 RepID=R7Q263_CHOCR|nr:Ascorbate Peroxidase, APX2 [Chondrus crispus]CDF32149.1 Ascorbate Peroxidase, APX2 [Chondrus crispus]|eukprot:XP_005711814.1 Ascorbate Peroxidase, APX2 [Chondrus crispus]